MDNRDRETFYSSESDDGNEDDAYELEPPDAEVLASEERRAKDAVEATRMSIDIDEVYRDADHERSGEILENWLRNFQFRFQVKHLLIATAVLAIILTLAKWQMLGTVAMVLVMISVAGLYLYLQWQDKKAQDEASRRRQELYALRRAHFERMSAGGAAVEHEKPAGMKPPISIQPLPNEVDETWQEAAAKQSFRIRFSLAELMVAMTTAAIIFGLVNVLGGETAATLLGFIALIGLAVHALGVEPPSVVVLGWWLILALYVLLSVAVAIWTSFA